MKFAYALLQRFGLLSETLPTDTVYESRLDRLRQGEARTCRHAFALRSRSSHPEA
jgi:hypothetical protein